MRAAIYARVSTVGHGQSPELQLREIREYCSHRGWQIVGEYVDAGVSGVKDSRPELNRLMADAHRGLTLAKSSVSSGKNPRSPAFSEKENIKVTSQSPSVNNQK